MTVGDQYARNTAKIQSCYIIATLAGGTFQRVTQLMPCDRLGESMNRLNAGLRTAAPKAG